MCLTNDQGELAHCTVKRLYGRTNKRDAAKQIGRHVLRLEHAQVSAEREQSKIQTASINDNIEIDLDKHYQISKTRKDAVDIYSYIYANPGDPAFDVRFRVCSLYISCGKCLIKG